MVGVLAANSNHLQPQINPQLTHLWHEIASEDDKRVEYKSLLIFEFDERSSYGNSLPVDNKNNICCFHFCHNM